MVTVQANANAALQTLHRRTVELTTEKKAWIILDTRNKTLSLEMQPYLEGDGSHSSVNTPYHNTAIGNDNVTIPADRRDGSIIIVGQIHGHPGRLTAEEEQSGLRLGAPGPSTIDENAARDIQVPVYPIDDAGVYKVDRSGNRSRGASPLADNPNVLKDALETSGGKPGSNNGQINAR